MTEAYGGQGGARSQTIVIETELLQSQAYLTLPGTAIKVLTLFLARRQMKSEGKKGHEQWDCVNNGKIVFPYAEAQKKLGIARPTFTRALDALIRHGFIDINHHGGGCEGDCTTYWISDRWRKYGEPGFVHKERPKGTRNRGLTPENWERLTGKKRSKSFEARNKNVTAPSNKNVTGSRKNGNSRNNKKTGERGLSVCIQSRSG